MCSAVGALRAFAGALDFYTTESASNNQRAYKPGMPNYFPLNWGADSNAPDDSSTPDSSPATERYPLEWGTHTDAPANEKAAPSAKPEFRALMPTLLGGADPDMFPARVTLAKFEPSNGNTGNAQLAQASNPSAQDKATAGVGQPRAMVVRNLPGVGDTYLDAEFAPKIDAFRQHARDRGIEIDFESTYRSPAYQEYLRDHQREKNVIYTPAEQSLHSAGLAVDIRNIDRDPVEREIILEAARKAGLDWGASFQDRPHFYFDPGGNRGALIRDFVEQVRQKQIADMKAPI